MTTRLLLAGNHTIAREGLRVFLERENDFKVVGECEDGRTAVHMVRKVSPDVVVMDAVLPELNGVEATRQICAEAPEVRVVGLSIHHDHFLGRMMRAGASAYLGKTDSARNLVEAIRQTLAGNKYVSPQLIDAFVGYMQGPENSGSPVLTPREREVLQLTAEGKSPKQTAARLMVSEKTVRSQLGRLMHKLHLHNVAALTKYAIREGVTSPDP